MADVSKVLIPYPNRVFGTNQQTRGTIGELSEQIVNGQAPEYDLTTPPRHAYHFRAPDILTCKSWIKDGIYIKCFCNPASGNWSFNKRGAFTKTAGGGVHNTWRNRHRGTYLDVFPLALEFQAGNIHPSAAHNVDLTDTTRALMARNNPSLPPGLDNWYRFLDLADVASLFGNDANYIVLVWHTRVFPNLWVEGFFDDQSIAMNESADNGNTCKWSATLQVVRTVPKLSSYTLMRAAYIDYIRSNSREASPYEIAAYNEDREWRNARTAFEAGLNKLDTKVARTEGQKSKLQKFKEKTSNIQISEQGTNVLA